MAHNEIRKFRKAAGYTQEELAQKIGITHATLSRYETGEIDPPASQLQRISFSLGVSVSDLLGNKHKMEQDECSKLFRHNLSIAIELIDVDSFSGVPEAEYDYHKLQELSESSYPISLEEAFEASDFLGESLDDLLREDYEECEQNKDPIPVSGDGSGPADSTHSTLLRNFDRLNQAGQKKAVERVEELTEIPRYQATTAPQSTLAPPEGTDTTPATDAPETPPEGK